MFSTCKKILGINNTRLIKNKTDLINFLHFFHNTVNKRYGKAIFKAENLVNYKKMNFSAVIQIF